MAHPTQAGRHGFYAAQGLQRGFTYLLLLFVVAVSGMTLALTGTLWSKNVQREKEQDLLFAGREMRRALEDYYLATPHPPATAQDANGSPANAANADQVIGEYPSSPKQLLEDHRYDPPRRYLRRLYTAPFGEADWQWERQGEQIMGVRMNSARAPMLKSGFLSQEEGFAQAAHYSDWLFRADPSARRAQLMSQQTSTENTDSASNAQRNSVVGNSPLQSIDRLLDRQVLQRSTSSH